MTERKPASRRRAHLLTLCMHRLRHQRNYAELLLMMDNAEPGDYWTRRDLRDHADALAGIHGGPQGLDPVIFINRVATEKTRLSSERYPGGAEHEEPIIEVAPGEFRLASAWRNDSFGPLRPGRHPMFKPPVVSRLAKHLAGHPDDHDEHRPDPAY